MGIRSFFKGAGQVALLASNIATQGASGKVVNILKSSGILKDPAQELQAMAALRDFEKDLMAAETARIEAVNATIRIELQHGNWWQKSWRPGMGWALILNAVNHAIMQWFPNIAERGELLSSQMILALGAGAGIAAWTRGKAKEAQAKHGGLA